MPFSEKQQVYLHSATHRWNIKTGATRSGKTHLDYTYVIPRRITTCQGKGLIVLIGNTMNSIERNVLSPMRSIWSPQLVGNIRNNDNTVYLFGRRCFVVGADKISQVPKIQGSGMAYCYGDEIPTWNEEVFQMLKSRLDEPTSVFDGTGNPANPNHWFKKFLDSDADIYHQHYQIDDNPFLSADFVSNLKKEYTGVWYRRYILGEWCLAEGLIYPNFNHDRHVTAAVPALRSIDIAVDAGQSNATVFLAIGEGVDNRAYILSEYYHSGKETGNTKSPLAYAKDFDAWIHKVNAMYPGVEFGDIWLDPAALGFKAQLWETGQYRARKAKNDVVPGIQVVSSIIDSDLLRVHPSCTHTLAEFMTYAWDSKASDKGEDKPIKESDHCMDAIRYKFYSRKNDWAGVRPIDLKAG